MRPGVAVSRLAGMQNMQSRTVTVGNSIPALPSVYLTYACPDPRCEALTHNARVPDTRAGHKTMHAFVTDLIGEGTVAFMVHRISTDGTRTDITGDFLWRMVRDEMDNLVNEILGGSL